MCVRGWVDCGVTRGSQGADLLTKTPHSISELYEYMGTSQAEWESRSRGEVVSVGKKEGGVWMIGALARWMLVGIKRVRENEKDGVDGEGGRGAEL